MFFRWQKGKPSIKDRIKLGFTLIELLIVIAIVGVLLSVVYINISSTASMSASMATQDSLRIIRYARNMALQTQQPINVRFSKGKIEIIPTEMSSLTTSSNVNDTDPITEEDNDSDAPKTSSIENPNRLEGHGFDDISLVKHYQEVSFKLASVDEYTMGSDKDFERREKPISNTELKEDKTDFILTIHANGTMRPCTIEVYSGDSVEEGSLAGTVSFDFLCTGTIEEED